VPQQLLSKSAPIGTGSTSDVRNKGADGLGLSRHRGPAHHSQACALVVDDVEHGYFTIPPYFLAKLFTYHIYIALHVVCRLIYMEINKIKEK
jgi:hypothetical protein